MEWRWRWRWMWKVEVGAVEKVGSVESVMKTTPPKSSI
jgi:hypothetical protein